MLFPLVAGILCGSKRKVRLAQVVLRVKPCPNIWGSYG